MSKSSNTLVRELGGAVLQHWLPCWGEVLHTRRTTRHTNLTCTHSNTPKRLHNAPATERMHPLANKVRVNPSTHRPHPLMLPTATRVACYRMRQGNFTLFGTACHLLSATSLAAGSAMPEHVGENYRSLLRSPRSCARVDKGWTANEQTPVTGCTRDSTFTPPGTSS